MPHLRLIVSVGLRAWVVFEPHNPLGDFVDEYPIEYDYVPGQRVALSWAGGDVPVPPKWVQDRADVPERMKLACLSSDLSEAYPTKVRDVLVDYVRNWTDIRESGTDLLITGRVPNHRRLWAGSAVLNEITMRYSNRMGVSTGWLAIRGLHWLMDAQAKGGDSYTAMRNRVLNVKLLLIDDLFQLPPSSKHRWFLESLYQHRFDQKLPTITTLNTEIVGGDWSTVRKLIGPSITEILSTNHEHFFAQFPKATDE